MAGYREHISVSGLIGAAYGVGATLMMGFTPIQAILAGCLTWVAGMLPDLDSQSGRPVRELFGLVAALSPLVMMSRIREWVGGDPELVIVTALGIYFGIRYGGSTLLGKFTVHRGMFHSIPALVIAGELAFLAYKSESTSVRLLMGGGVCLGFLSHLLLDELYSVQWTGVRPKLRSSAGSAMKVVGKSFIGNAIAFSLLASVTYVTLLELGMVKQPNSDPTAAPVVSPDAERTDDAIEHAAAPLRSRG